MSEETKTPMQRVDTFIQRLHDLDLVSKPLHEKDRIIAHTLAGYLSDYSAVDPKSIAKEGMASLCEVWINRALASGIIKEGEGLMRQIRRYTQEVERLTQDNQKLAERLAEIQRELEASRRSRFSVPAWRSPSEGQSNQ